MIPVPNPIPEPAAFDARCRIPGNRWLAEHPTAKANQFPGHWQRFQLNLAQAFTYRCGWSAMYIGTDGAVDHFLSRENDRERTSVYEWSNYRYISTTVNSSKQALDQAVLDPFEVQHGWFEVRLPAFMLICTELVPATYREKADFTIQRLKLDVGSKFIANRRQWYCNYLCSNLPMTNLREYAPLMAAAIETWQSSGRPLPACERQH